jgi:enterochelin esterase-like enzyme
MRVKLNRHQTLIIASAIALTSISAIGAWYVFVAGSPQLDPPKVETGTGLNFQVKSFYSTAMGTPRRYGLVLPPGYEQHPDRHYPVVVLLHGGHGDEWDYEKKAALTSVLHDLYVSKKLPPSIVVTPDGSDNRGTSPFWDPDYYDGENGKVATLIGVDLVKEIKSQYRTLNEPQYWAMGGLSSGAWGALNIGLRYLNEFTIFFSHTGYFTDGNNPQNSPLLFIDQIPTEERQKIRIYLDAGKADEEFLDATKEFHDTLDRLDIKNEFHVFPGGHGIVGQQVGWNYWHRHLKDSLSFVGRQFKTAQHNQELHPAEPQAAEPQAMENEGGEVSQTKGNETHQVK